MFRHSRSLKYRRTSFYHRPALQQFRAVSFDTFPGSITHQTELLSNDIPPERRPEFCQFTTFSSQRYICQKSSKHIECSEYFGICLSFRLTKNCPPDAPLLRQCHHFPKNCSLIICMMLPFCDNNTITFLPLLLNIQMFRYRKGNGRLAR